MEIKCAFDFAQCSSNQDWEDNPDASSHTEQEENHAALQLQEIPSVPMTQVSGESSANSVEVKQTVNCVSARLPVQSCATYFSMDTHTHTHKRSRIEIHYFFKFYLVLYVKTMPYN